MADAKITQLSELTVVDLADLLAIVDDPAGTPITKKITVSNLLNGFLISEQSPSGTGTVTFSSIPSAFRHLRIEFVGRSTEVATVTVANLRFNGDTGANYDGQRGAFTTTTTLADQLGATSVNALAIPGASATANYASGGIIDIPYYKETTFFKVFMSKMHYLTAQTTTNVFFREYNGLWRSTSAINQIDLILTAGDYVAGSKFSLYGIR